MNVAAWIGGLLLNSLLQKRFIFKIKKKNRKRNKPLKNILLSKIELLSKITEIRHYANHFLKLILHLEYGLPTLRNKTCQWLILLYKKEKRKSS